MNVPEIRPLGEPCDFDDSSLLFLGYVPETETVRVVLSTPDEWDHERLWEIQLSGVLRMDLESVGDGGTQHPDSPPEIYSVYLDDKDSERARWVRRLRETGAREPEQVHCVMLASSYLRGWGERENLEGIRIVCRQWTIGPAPAEFSGREFQRPKIPAGP